MEHIKGKLTKIQFGETIVISANDYMGVAFINPKGDYNMGILSGEDTANAKHLVKCWNNYNQLLNTVKTIYDLPHNLVCPSIRNLCKEAIQEAEEN